MPFDEIGKDPTLQLVHMLVAPDVDRARADRIRERCHHAFGRRPATMPPRGVEFAVVGTLCGVYLVEVLARALSLLG